MVDAARKTLIVGAAMAVVHQIEIGQINQDRAHGWYDESHSKWDNFKHLRECLRSGASPDMARMFPNGKDTFAHLRQSMRVDYDEWFAIFPWLENASDEVG